MISFFRRYVFHNFGLKLISLAIAVLLWLAVTRDPVAEIAMTVPIEFRHVPGSLEISSEKLPQVQVRVRGPARVIRGLDQSDVHAILDLKGAQAGERTYDIRAQLIRVPRDTEVVQIVPTQFRINFDHSATRQVEVKPRVIGSFAAGFHIAQEGVIPDPPVVSIAGPEKRVNAVENAITDPVDATGVVGRATFTTHVYVADPLVRVVRPDSVRVTVITEKTEGRRAK